MAEGMENLNDEAAALLITISYNLGRVNEKLCLHDEAEKLYRDIIKQRPNYMDCEIFRKFFSENKILLRYSTVRLLNS